MEWVYLTLITAAFLCALVTGFLFAFAVIVMPGTRSLSDREFLRSFQSMDRIIQDGHPLFMLVWIGSVLALIAAGIMGILYLKGTALLFTILALVAYMAGVQLPTVAVNVPLNNMLQALDIDGSDEHSLVQARDSFEDRWNQWNIIRTAFASITTLLLILLLCIV